MRQQRGKAQGEPESSRRTGRGEGRTGERKLTSEEASSQMVAAIDGFDGDAGSKNRSLNTPAVAREPLRPVQGHHDPGVQEAPTPTASHWCETRQSCCGLDSGPVGPTIFG